MRVTKRAVQSNYLLLYVCYLDDGNIKGITNELTVVQLEDHDIWFAKVYYDEISLDDPEFHMVVMMLL